MLDEHWHGTIGGYTNRRCRCERCRTAWAADARERRATFAFHEHRSMHGTASTYDYGCRCEACRVAHRERRRKQRATA